MARKVIESNKIGDKSFQTERQNLEHFKDCLSKHGNIMLSFATFVHGSQFNIISQLADLDLHKFLYGIYPEFSQQRSRFTLSALFEEAWCLASALNFLHEELRLRTGPISCAHMDLKPENILIEGFFSLNTDMAVGRWKIGDFGIAIIESMGAEARGSRTGEGQQLAPGDVIRERSINPPREPGPFQAPEMQPNKGLHVSKSSDMWSFGCIIAMILAFSIGGPEEVQQLYKCRKDNYVDDYFYTEDRVVKTEILNWLENQTNDQKLKEHWHWIGKCRDLIQKLLTIEKKERPSAEETGTRLLGIKDGSAGMPIEKQQLWGLSNQQQPIIVLPNPARDDNDSLQSTQSLEDQPVPNHLSVPSRPSLTNHDELLSVKLSFRPSKTSEQTSFVRLEIPPHVKKTFLSPSGQRAAFLSENIVYLYQLDILDFPLHRWDAKASLKLIPKEAMERWNVFKCSETRQWTSVFLAGSYCALASISREHDDDTVFSRSFKRLFNFRLAYEYCRKSSCMTYQN